MEPNNEETLFALKVDDESAAYFREAGKWVKFITIACFIILGFFLLFLTFSSALIVQGMQTSFPDMAVAGGVVVGVLIVVLMIFVLLCIFLFRFASLTRRGIEAHDQLTFNEGLKSLKYYFVVYGVIALLGIVFSVLTNLTKILA